MKYFSMFSGVGGFDLGLNRHGFECVGYSEIEKYAVSVYRYNFGTEVKNYGNATEIDPEQLPDFELLCGGFPCQAFSVAGRRKGFEDTRGTLFFEIARIIKCKRPRYLFLENVKGLLNHDKGKTFGIIMQTLDELGYDVQWQVLNSKNFGVPQNRERVFIIGHIRGQPRPEIFPLKGASRATTFSNTIRTGGKGSLTAKHAWDLVQINSPKHSNDRVYGAEGISPTLNTMQGGNRQPFVMQHSRDKHGKTTHYNLRHVAGTLKQPSGNQQNFVIPCLTPDRMNKRQNGRRFKTNGEPMFTINAQDKHGIFDGTIIRRLTPLECERLQGFPDGWTKFGIDDKGNKVSISDTQRYKQMGNAVTVNVIEAIAERLKNEIESEKAKTG